MSKIIFLKNPSYIYDAEFYQIGQHQIRLVFTNQIPKNDILLSGLQLVNEYNGFIQTKREDYKYIYRKYDDNPLMVELCNDDIEYVEPEPVVIPEPEPYVPTYKEVLTNKINELSYICQATIESGLEINGLHYSYTEKDQINLNDIVSTVKLTGLPLGYHADSQNCAEYTAEELMSIYIKLAMNKYCQQTYFNQSREYLKSLEESDKNKKIIESYAYGTPLTGSYLETYNNMVNLYNAQIQALFPDTK
ncbi:MAG: hypothetical protein NC321_12905 [Clostridium sp.]|nr:hypothetical protein [Clostridium sp.]